jgi:acetyl esterase/lipase
LQYRLSTLPASKTSNPYPAALQDSLSAYLYLINELKISPKNIILSGDSAGANAAIAILRYITEYGGDLGIPNPVAAWLWSPWVQVSSAVVKATLVGNKNYSTDYLPYSFTQWGALAYAGLGGDETLKNPYVSQLGHPFKTSVPLFVNTGDAEVLFEDDCEWSKMMKEAGNNVTLDIEPNTPHDPLLIGGQLGFDKEATNSAKRAGEWFKGLRK